MALGRKLEEKTMSKPEEEPMSLRAAINARRSVRSYAPHKLDRAAVNALLAAAVRAPTARHEEPWAFVIVQDSALLRRLSDRAKGLIAEEAQRTHHDRGGHAPDVFSQPEFNIFYNAGTLIVICAKPMGPFVVADCWLAAENLMLAACAMGLGTCVIGSAASALNTREAKAELGISAEIAAIAPIIVGIPSGETAHTVRKEPEILAWK
jgi:nitroreductase